MNIEVFTPDNISQKVCERVLDPFLESDIKIDNLSVCDPCVGMGDLLIYFIKMYNIPIKNVYAFDIKEEFIEYTINRFKKEFNEVYYENFKTCDFLFTNFCKKFNIIVMNPPYLGGVKISSNLGSNYLYFLKTTWEGKVGDLSAYFLRKAYECLANKAVLSCVTTNTINQGSTRLIGLKYLVDNGMSIYNAYTNIKWDESKAAVIVNIFTLTNIKHENTI